MEQMLDFPWYFQIHGISKASKGAYMEQRIKLTVEIQNAL